MTITTMDARPNTLIKTDLKTLIGIIFFTGTATVWGYTMWSDVQKLKADSKEMKDDIAEIRRAVAPMPVAAAKSGPKAATP